jgi:signal transduction histidine kinase
MDALIAEVDSRTRILAEKTGLEFEINITPDFPEEIIGDKMRIQQIWTNLLSNAIKFTEEGYIHTYIHRHGADEWAIKVIDTGKGIPKESQKYIFDAFVQVDGSPTRQRAGTGLGLSISASIVEMMGGRIHLHSEVNKGTTFIVYLPLHLTNKNPGGTNP